MIRSLHHGSAAIFGGVLMFSSILGAQPNPASVVGDYLCRSMGSGPCDTQTTISLHEDGTWGWRYFSGKYELRGDRMRFSGVGLGAWGPAIVGSNTLTFMTDGKKVVWEKPSAASPGLAGTYTCATAAGGGPCQTRHPIEIRSDGTWSWGVQRGSYSMMGGQLRFSGGLTTGPSNWGSVVTRGANLIFQTDSGPSEWRKQ